MSCIATFYILPEALREGFKLAKENEKRTVTSKRMLFFTKTEEVGDQYLWEFLDKQNEPKFEFQYSGFLLVDYLEVYLNVFGEYFHPVDDYFSTIKSERARDLLGQLKQTPIDQEKISAFLTEDQGLPKSEHSETIEAYSKVHDDFIKALEKVAANHFGILHLSF
ncbi:MAG: hypothetical protein ACSHX8_09895 [Opitutaceae bacterium]